MSAESAPILVLGVGNALMGDDGVGGRVVAELLARRGAGSIDLPAGVELVDGGALGPALLPWLAGASGLVLVDAVLADEPPGTVAVWRDEQVAAAPASTSGGVDELLAAGRVARSLPAAISLVGIVPGPHAPGDRLGADVAAALPAAIEATLSEVRRVDVTTRGAGSAARHGEMAGVTA